MLKFTKLNPRFDTLAPIDPDRTHGLIALNTVGSTPLAISGLSLSGVSALVTAIVDGTGTQITTFGGGTQYADGALRGTATGTLAMVDDGTNIQSAAGDTSGRQKVVGAAADGAAQAGNPVLMAGQASGTVKALATDTQGVLQVNLGNVAIGTFGNSDGNSAGLTSGLFMTENQFFNGSSWDRGRSIINATDTTGTGIGAVGILAQYDDTSPGTVTENRFGNVRMSVRREMYNQIRDAAGNERGANVTANNGLVTEEYTATTIYNGKKTVTTAGTRVTLASSQTIKSVTIKALAANTGTIYVGDGSVASTTGFALAAGDTVSIDIANLATVNLDSSVNGEGVTYVAVN